MFFLLQQEAEGALRRLGQALAQQAGGVITDGLGGGDDAHGGVFAHRQAAVEHPVDGGDTDAGGLCKVVDGGTLDHVTVNFSVIENDEF
jgi:hypothetical protein